jgi:phage baseplate assembly protein W
MAQQYIGITLPIRLGRTGMFEQSTSSLQQTRSNLKNLILTKKGERLMQPELGCDLWEILFEQITEDTKLLARTTVVDAVDRWLPFLEIAEFELETPVNSDVHKIRIQVSYRFRNNPNVLDSITIDI